MKYIKQIAFVVLLCSVGFTSCADKNSIPYMPVSEIMLDATSLVVKPGESTIMSACAIPVDATNREINWSSNDESIVLVSHDGVVVGVKPGKTIIKASSVADSSVVSECIVTVSINGGYVVGDLYPDETNPSGVVFWIDPVDVSRGKAVSFEQGSVVWGYGDEEAGTDDLNDGKINMAEIETKVDWAKEYPAFGWCAERGQGWYLPALNELIRLADAIDQVNATIESTGNLPISYANYWTSSEQAKNPQNIALTVDLGRAKEGWASKNGSMPVRATISF